MIRGQVEITDEDVWRVERLSEAAMRAGHEREAIGGFALALRLRLALRLEEEVRMSTSRNGEHDPRSRFGLYRLCDCPECEGSGKVPGHDTDPFGKPYASFHRCPDCRGEGRIRQEVASCETPEAVGVALVTLAREGEWEGCPFGLLDREGETNKKWLILPWLPSARNVTDAARTLARSKKSGKTQ